MKQDLSARRTIPVLIAGILLAAFLTKAGLTDDLEQAVADTAPDAVRALGDLIVRAVQAVTP
jgi:hypothetical protein